MHIVSFNVNSVRQRFHQINAVIKQFDPAIIGLQETKVSDTDFPEDEIKKLGFDVIYHGQKTHYGVAILTRLEHSNVLRGFPNDDDKAQKRLIAADFTAPNGSKITVINGYFPQGDNRSHEVKFPGKAKFYSDVLALLQQRYQTDQQLVLMGDFNVAPKDIDIGIGEDNAKRWLRTGKASFLPEEREWLDALFTWGLHDTFRARYPNEDSLFSWFDYRSRGFEREPKRGLRIDHILASTTLNSKLVDAGIDYTIRAMEKPSDHCPVWSKFDL